jgi:hypothetical protein
MVVLGVAVARRLLDIAERPPASKAAVIKACLKVCGRMGLVAEDEVGDGRDSG